MRDTSFRDFVLDQLDGLPGVRSRAMFGGHGLYLEEEFFGMIVKGRLYLRTDERSREEYRALGSEPVPFGDDPAGNVYWSVPEDVLEDARLLREWAAAAALVPRKPKRASRPSRSSARKPRGPSRSR